MRPVTFDEISNIAQYELERPEYRPRMMAIKDRRRIRVGDHMTFLFENRETVRYQIQEMMRIERLVKESDIRHELETYNELIPGPNELSASLLIEYDSPEERAVWLRKLLGLEKHVWIQVGKRPPAPAVFDTRQIATDRLSSVQYIKFRLTPEDVAAFGEGVRIIVDHPSYSHSTELTAEQLATLAEDFR